MKNAPRSRITPGTAALAIPGALVYKKRDVGQRRAKFGRFWLSGLFSQRRHELSGRAEEFCVRADI